MTRIRPPALTTKRLLTPVMATRPTFWAKALWVKELNSGEMALESMSARRPSPMRLESTLVPTISPTAMMSAEVSVRVTRMTISMEMIAAISNVGGAEGERGGERDDLALAHLGEVGHAEDEGDHGAEHHGQQDGQPGDRWRCPPC